MRRTVARLVSMTALIGATLLGPSAALAAPTIGSVSMTIYACPASIQSPADLENAGGPGEVCSVGGRPGDFGTLPDGWSWEIPPVEYDLQASFHVHGTTLTNPEPNAGGHCDSSTLTCTAFQSYGWFEVPAGRFTLTEVTVPTGYAFGWAILYLDGQIISGATDTAARSVTARPARGTQQIYVQFINIVP